MAVAVPGDTDCGGWRPGFDAVMIAVMLVGVSVGMQN